MTKMSEVAMDYTRRLPEMPTKTLARLMCKERPKLFHEIEYARSILRKVRGQRGDQAREECKWFTSTYQSARDTCAGLVKLPEPLAERNAWCVVKTSFSKALVLSDVHVPFHDALALKVAVKHGQDRNVDCVILNGDLCDFYAISFWERDPEQRSMANEVKIAREALKWMRQEFPKARIIFKEGNHEERLWRYLWRVAPEFSGMEEFGLKQLLKLDDLGIELVDNKKPILCGEHLYVLHGHEFRAPMTNPVNPARGLYLRTKCNAICGDLHQTSQHTEAGLQRIVSCWSVGCLSTLHPLYMPLNKWNHGFCVVELAGKQWQVDNKKIIDLSVV
jgi:predicted phosphodiesterase